MTLNFVNIGCRLNYAEMDYLAAYFRNKGHQIKEFFRERGEGVVLINTCAVTKEAERKSLLKIRRYAKFHPVIVTGCLTELAQEKIEKIPNVFWIIGQKEKEALMEDTIPEPSRNRAFLKIVDGCNGACTFCIVPKLRGREIRSKEERIILKEIAKVTEAGFSEIVLTGLNLGLYGREFGKTLAALLLRIFDLVKGEFRIRLSSLEPDSIDESLLKTIAALPVTRHLHIPIQSLDRNVLLKMGRRYSPEEVKEKIAMILSFLPAANIGCDIIVGFPNETEDAFERTRGLLAELPLGYFHIFPYSPRPGTPAFSFPDAVSPQEKKRRVAILRELGRRKRESYQRQFLFQELLAVREREGWALTDNYIRVKILSKSIPQGLFLLRLERICDGFGEGRVLE